MDKKTYLYSKDKVRKLQRGGFTVLTSSGTFQYGVPPETVKDTMVLDHGVPDKYILPNQLFNWYKGISIGEIEFPIYFNFFIMKRKTKIICRIDQIIQMKKVLQEALFGPEEIDIESDYDLSQSEYAITDLMKEMNFFRSSFLLDDVVEFIPYSFDNTVQFEAVKIENRNNRIIIYDNNEKVVDFPGFIDYKGKFEIGERLAEPYFPPLFGITCLGPSHGFDPKDNTSGFLIWINHKGIMVDPPVNSTEWLINSNVSPKLIDSIILTHCHADHDAGTFQKILEEGKVTLYTTETVLMSFLRKYSSLSGIETEKLKKLFSFQPIKIGRAVYIHGAEFKMFYSLHSIPTIGFRLNFENHSIAYTSDHNNDPSNHKKLFEDNVISESRYKELQSFPWDSDVIYHEAGIPPLHTPVAFLDSLPDDVKRKIFVYHIAAKDFPRETKLNLLKFGIENTLYFNVRKPEFEKTYQILGLLNNLDFFQDIPVQKAQEFLTIVQEERYSKGDKIIEKGSLGDKFYIIYMGNISVNSGDSLSHRKIYGTYDYFGEVALVTKQTRMADVFAETDVILYTITRDKFLNFIAGTDFEITLQKLAKTRTAETWNLLSSSNFFKYCSTTQKTWLESMFIPMEKKGSGILMKTNDVHEYIYIIRSGEVIMSKDNADITVLKRGDFIGTLDRVYSDLPSRFTFRYENDILLYAMKAEDIKKFAHKNPGLIMKLKYDPYL
ncbi:MAG: cAMP/cGMP-dependent 3',5'-cyclic-AMP/GMP phosphodiesterase [Spirochaetes bacterium]|nr:cAMP/cGMP-dependent 3',5'-cyclic-AMP/GMP phosphodiesterase [Spirochaetota bacterium]